MDQYRTKLEAAIKELNLEGLEKDPIESISCLCKIAVNHVRKQFNCQVACIYLIDKDGILTRCGINGIDSYGHPIPEDWLLDDKGKLEPYEPGKSFTGKGIPVNGQKPETYRRSQHSNHLRYEYTDKHKYQYGNDYHSCLGEMSSGLSVKIIGSSRAYGAIDVYNKKNPKNEPIVFSVTDLLLLETTSTLVAAYVSKIRRKPKQLINRILIDAHYRLRTEEINLEDICKKIADHLISTPTNYKVCVIRARHCIGEMSEDIQNWRKLAISYTADINWDDGTDRPNPEEPNITTKVVETGEPMFIKDIKEALEKKTARFRYPQRCIRNSLNAIGIVPLKFDKKTIGTITVVVGSTYYFSQEEIDSLEEIAGFLASVILAIQSNKSPLEFRSANDGI